SPILPTGGAMRALCANGRRRASAIYCYCARCNQTAGRTRLGLPILFRLSDLDNLWDVNQMAVLIRIARKQAETALLANAFLQFTRSRNAE
ncbi:MAG: hypothetical protein ABSB33_13250, partial [Tepidisphaeraceae bacterium]